jgi:peptidoglycan/xylan/chitin deacetylase (PgdA/CDA1 family)
LATGSFVAESHSTKGALVRKAFLSLVLIAALGPALRSAKAPAPVYVTLWFDTEDYLLPQDDDATKRLAELLSRLGVPATFKIVGEKARVLDRRGRSDVIAALKRHDIGYHSNTHSQQPTIAVYLQNAGWEDGRAEFKRREQSGVDDIKRIFGVTPVAYGQPGSAWAPQTYPALRDMGIKVYLDEADQVGLDDQPFYYGGMLNIFRMRTTLVRMALNGGSSLTEGQAAFDKVHAALTARGGGTVSIYYHPNEWVQAEFWDAVNFRRGANPPPGEWKPPRMRPAAETERAFADFEQFVRFIKAKDGVRFVTATELAALYADRALGRDFGRDELLAIARAVQKDFDFLKLGGYALSGADAFALLTDAAAAVTRTKDLPAAIRLTPIDGPAQVFSPSTGQLRSSSFSWEAFGSAVRDTAAYCRVHHRMPDEVWIGAENLSPVDYLATLGAVVEQFLATGKLPASVDRKSARTTFERYVAEDSTKLWGWIIFPEGFHAPRIMELARLQAWTLKPALLGR